MFLCLANVLCHSNRLAYLFFILFSGKMRTVNQYFFLFKFIFKRALCIPRRLKTQLKCQSFFEMCLAKGQSVCKCNLKRTVPSDKCWHVLYWTALELWSTVLLFNVNFWHIVRCSSDGNCDDEK